MNDKEETGAIRITNLNDLEIGKRYLIQICKLPYPGNPILDEIRDVVVLEKSPDGQYIKLKDEGKEPYWRKAELFWSADILQTFEVIEEACK